MVVVAAMGGMQCCRMHGLYRQRSRIYDVYCSMSKTASLHPEIIFAIAFELDEWSQLTVVQTALVTTSIDGTPYYKAGHKCRSAKRKKLKALCYARRRTAELWKS